MGHSDLDPAVHERRPWNAGHNVGAKRPLRPRDIWTIRFYLDEHTLRYLGVDVDDALTLSEWTDI